MFRWFRHNRRLNARSKTPMTIVERVTRWPYFWGFFVGGAALPLFYWISWAFFLFIFPRVRSELQGDSIIDEVQFLAIGATFLQLFRGALLGWATELWFHAHMSESWMARPLAILTGAIGIWFFGPMVWLNWNALPLLLNHYEEAPRLAEAVHLAFVDAGSLLWSIALILAGVFAPKPSKRGGKPNLEQRFSSQF